MYQLPVKTFLLVFVQLALAVSDRSDTVDGYAELCYKEMGITAEQLQKIPDCEGDAKSGAVRLESYKHEGGRTLSDKDHNMKQANPHDCDNPSWAENDCYGNSWARFIPIGKPGVYALMLCRHGHRWSNDPKKFSNISIILYSRNNGKTCFFTAEEKETPQKVKVPVSGVNIPSLHSEEGKKFWDSPVTMEKNFGSCVRCHDSGPMMNNPWFYNQMTEKASLPEKLKAFHTKALKDGKHPYDPFVGEFLNQTPRWKITKDNLKYITVGRAGLTPNSGTRSCTSCHKIGIQSTCDTWIKVATGDFQGYDKKMSSWAKQFPQSHWMPLERDDLQTVEQWRKEYYWHLEYLKRCCAAAKKGPEEMKKVPGCKFELPNPPQQDDVPGAQPRTH